MKTIQYSDGSSVQAPVIQIWDDLNTERSGMYRAYWCSSPDADSGSPVIGHCSPGGSQPTVNGAAREALRLFPGELVFRNGRQVKI